MNLFIITTQLKEEDDLIGTIKILDKAQGHDFTCLFVFGNWFLSVILCIMSILNPNPCFITEDLKFC